MITHTEVRTHRVSTCDNTLHCTSIDIQTIHTPAVLNEVMFYKNWMKMLHLHINVIWIPNMLIGCMLSLKGSMPSLLYKWAGSVAMIRRHMHFIYILAITMRLRYFQNHFERSATGNSYRQSEIPSRTDIIDCKAPKQFSNHALSLIQKFYTPFYQTNKMEPYYEMKQYYENTSVENIWLLTLTAVRNR